MSRAVQTRIAALVVALLLQPVAASAESLLCRDGHRQSPIDIVAPVKTAAPALEFDYRPAPLRIANDGHTLRVRFANDSRLLIGKAAYRLQQLHFHTPGGERVAGEEFPLSAHLLHRSGRGQLLAVVVLFRQGAENPSLADLWTRIPASGDGDQVVDGTFDVSRLLPPGHAYYRYQGSLTASPCTEGVTWVVMKQPLQVSAGQLAHWRAHFVDNMRPAQPLHGRIVSESR